MLKLCCPHGTHDQLKYRTRCFNHKGNFIVPANTGTGVTTSQRKGSLDPLLPRTKSLFAGVGQLGWAYTYTCENTALHFKSCMSRLSLLPTSTGRTAPTGSSEPPEPAPPPDTLDHSCFWAGGPAGAGDYAK